MRNWRYGETVNNDEVAKNLNDGPESLVFVSAAQSPLGREMLLAATPLSADAMNACAVLASYAMFSAASVSQAPVW